MGQRIELPNPDELTWIGENLEVAKSILAQYAPASSLDPRGLDKALYAWTNQQGTERIEPNALVNALGIAFGQYLIDSLGLKWAVVSDEHGTDIAVHGTPGDVLVFPTSATAKRVSDGATRFFEDLYQQMSTDIGQLRRQSH